MSLIQTIFVPPWTSPFQSLKIFFNILLDSGVRVKELTVTLSTWHVQSILTSRYVLMFMCKRRHMDWSDQHLSNYLLFGTVPKFSGCPITLGLIIPVFPYTETGSRRKLTGWLKVKEYICQTLQSCVMPTVSCLFYIHRKRKTWHHGFKAVSIKAIF